MRVVVGVAVRNIFVSFPNLFVPHLKWGMPMNPNNQTTYQKHDNRKNYLNDGRIDISHLFTEE